MVLSVLMVAEKPSIAQSVAHILSGGKASFRKGAGTPVHEYSGSFQGTSAKFKVTSVTGHVFSIDFPAEFNDRAKTNPLDLFEARTVKSEATKGRTVRHLQHEAAGVDALVLWLDCDREGENICYEVMQVVVPLMVNKGGNPLPHADKTKVDCSSHHLGRLDRERVHRSHFSSLAPKDIKAAMEKLQRPSIHEALSVEARQEIDLKVGVAFTRFQSNLLQSKYGDLDSTLISYGPCQTPTLQFCVRRWDEINNFKPQPHWTIHVDAKGATFNWDRGRLFDVNVVNVFKAKVEGNEATVVSVTTKKKSLSRPVGLNTVQMLRQASTRLGMGPQQSMQVAERLYLSGYVTYPRTESTAYASNFDVRGLVQALRPHNPAYVDELLAGALVMPTGGEDAGDHPPITPVRPADNSLAGDLQRLFSLIAQNFLASVSGNCHYLSTVVRLEVSGECFETSGMQVVDPGFTKISPSLEMRNSSLPSFTDGTRVPISAVSLIQGSTSAPSLLSESDLLGLMDQHGIGTDASMATHVNNICERNYVRLVGERRLEPTTLGVSLIHAYLKIDPQLVLPKVRQTIEAECSLVARGRAHSADVIKHTLDQFKQKFVYFASNIHLLDSIFASSFNSVEASGSVFSRCGQCGCWMTLITKKPQRLFCKKCCASFILPQNGTIKKYKGNTCPIDGYELVFLSTRTGKNLPLCPMCYNDPPFEDVRGPSMNCLQCLHQTCTFGYNRQMVFECPQEECEGTIFVDEMSQPNYKAQCSDCNYSISLPKSKSVKPTRRACDECGARLLDIVLHKDNPFKDGSTDRVACLLCDAELSQNIQGFFAKSRGGRGRRGGGRGRGRSRGRGR